MVALLALGLSHGLQTPPLVITVSPLGGVLLIWMGGSMVWGAFNGTMTLPKPEMNIRLLNYWQLLGLGVGATIINPFWYGWWIAVGTTYLALPQVRVYGIIGLLVFYLGHIAGDYLWDSVLSGVVGGGRKWLTNRVYQGLIVVCGLYLIYLGGQFGWSGFQIIRGLLPT